MKKILLLFAFALLVYYSNAQTIQFDYDNAGNRINRAYITLPSPVRDTSTVSENLKTEDLSKIEAKFEFEKLTEGKIKIFPNPTEGDLMVRLENIANPNDISLQLYNSSGSLMQTQNLNSDYSAFDMKSLSPGIYILRIIRQDEKLEYKIIKK